MTQREYEYDPLVIGEIAAGIKRAGGTINILLNRSWECFAITPAGVTPMHSVSAAKIRHRITDYAANRVVDISKLTDAINGIHADSWSETVKNVAPGEDSDGGWYPTYRPELPLVSPPRVGMTDRLWLIQEGVFATLKQVQGHPDEHILVQYQLADAGSSLLVNSMRALIVADGESWCWRLMIGPDEISAMKKTPGTAEGYAVMLDGLGRTVTAVMVASGIAQADPDVVVDATTPPKLRKARERKGKRFARSTTRIDLPGFRYSPKTGRFTATRSSGVAWHMVRGHWRELRSDRFTHARGTKVWVSPHSRGRGEGAPRTVHRVDSRGAA